MYKGFIKYPLSCSATACCIRVCDNLTILEKKKIIPLSGSRGLKLIQNSVGHANRKKTLELLGGSNAFGITLPYLKHKSL